MNSPTSFTLNLSQVDYQVPDLLAGKDGMIVNPAFFKNVASLATKPAGAGPFTLTSYVPDSHANLVRNAELLGRQPDSRRELQRAVDHPAGADPVRA